MCLTLCGREYFLPGDECLCSVPAADTEQVLKSLEKRMQSKPEFVQTPLDSSVFERSTAQLICHVAG